MADTRSAYRGLGLGQAIPVHPTESNQPAKGLIGFDAPSEGDTPRKREKLWRALADMSPDGKVEVKARTRDQKTGRWSLGLHPSAQVIALDVDEPGDFRKGLAARGLGLPPATRYSTARGSGSPRTLRQTGRRPVLMHAALVGFSVSSASSHIAALGEACSRSA